MGGTKMAVPFLLLLIASSLPKISVSDPLFYESFDESFEGRWIVSEKENYHVPSIIRRIAYENSSKTVEFRPKDLKL